MTDRAALELTKALAALHAEAFETSWSAEAFACLMGQPGIALRSEQDGFILLQTAADEAEILTLAVRPCARRQGLATRLVEAAVTQVMSEGVSRLFLEVAEDNGPARALYSRLGFAQVGRRPRYYARAGGQTVDALLLARNLDVPLPSA